MSGSLVAGGWLIWVASVRANPPVSARIAAYTVQSDTRITATLTVDRPNPARPVACRVLAQATDFQPVAEQLVRVRASTSRVVDVRVDLTTLRRATTAVVRECSLIDPSNRREENESDGPGEIATLVRCLRTCNRRSG